MIIEAGFTTTIGVQLEYTDAKGTGAMTAKAEMVRVHVENLGTGLYDHVADVKPVGIEWPGFKDIYATIARKLTPQAKALARQIAIQIGWEVGTIPRGKEPGWETPMERGTGWVQSDMHPLGPCLGNGEAPVSDRAPLTTAVPQPTSAVGLSDDQIRSVARSVSSRLASCVTK